MAHDLTPGEVCVLRAYAELGTVAAVAAASFKSRHTVAAQLRSRHWEDRYSDMTATVNPSDGGHQAGYGAWIQLHQLVNTRASADRTDVNYHVGP